MSDNISALTDALIAERMELGVYDFVENHINKPKSSSLAKSVYGKSFFPSRQNNPSKGMKHQSFVDGTKNEVNFVVFGELAPSSIGTAIGAGGTLSPLYHPEVSAILFQNFTNS